MVMTLEQLREKNEGHELLSYFLDAAAVGTDRSTFYNTKIQQQETVADIHRSVLNFDRDLYALLVAFGSLNEYNRLLLTRNLLFNTGYVVGQGGARLYSRYVESKGAAIRYGLTNREKDWIEIENEIILTKVWTNVSVPRLLREIVKWRKEKLNNTRSKRLVLRFLLGHKDFAGWALRYRPNLRRVLSHAWGDARTMKIRKILAEYLTTGTVSSKASFCRFRESFQRYVGSADLRKNCEAILFIFGDYIVDFRDPMFAKYLKAINDPEQLPGLPFDIAIGLRNVKFKNFATARIKESKETQTQMSSKQAVRLQRSGQKDNVEIKKDLSALSLVDIIKYGYEMGFGPDVKDAIRKRVGKDAINCMFRPKKVEVIVDTSKSMFGREDRKLHPIAVAMSIALLMGEVAESCHVSFTGETTRSFPIPEGDTDLARSILNAYKNDPEVVLLITDGYENVSAGTVETLMRGLKKIGVKAPLIQLNPVLATEVGKIGGLRRVSELITVAPTAGPETISAMYEKYLLSSASKGENLPALKKWLLDKLSLKQIPFGVKQELENVTAIEFKPLKALTA
jgi:hypothetical protein